jgi:3-oxoacyl-[acyl-carrier protein] reductase
MFLEGKVAIVTAGGGPGMGSAIVRALAQQGASVAVADINGERARGVADEIADTGTKSLAIVADVSKKDDVTGMVDETMRAFGAVHILVNHAGASGSQLIENLPEETWRHVLGVHLDGTFFCTQAVIPVMKSQGWGRIVSTSSRAAYRTSPGAWLAGLSAYAAAKAGIIGFSRVAAAELGSWGITVNVIAPGLVAGSGMSGDPVALDEEEELRRSTDEGQVLAPRFVQPDEIAAGVIYFVGPGSDRTTGQVLHINGGSYFNA